MSADRYHELLALGAPELKPGWRYRVTSSDAYSSIYVCVEERSYQRRWLRGLVPVWNRVGKQYAVGAGAHTPLKSNEQWESLLVRCCVWASESAEQERSYRGMRNKWEGGHP